MADLLITHGIVVTMDATRRVIEDGAIAIIGDRIVAIGTTAEIEVRYQAPRTIDAQAKAILPGLIDAHAHAGHGLIKSLGAGDAAAWYQACHDVYTIGSTPEFWHAEAKLAALERLRFGVTTGVSLLGGGDAIMRTDDPIYGDAHCEGVLAVGTRSVVAIGPTRPPHPRRYARWIDGISHDLAVSFEQQLTTCETLIARWHRSHDAHVHIALLTPTLRAEHVATFGATNLEHARDQAQIVRSLSRDAGTIFTQDGHTTGSVAYAHGLGLLGPDALLSHATNLTPEEIALCAATDTRIAHNPSAIASILGRCPVPELQAAGVTVALGSDATAPDRSGDMFRHMQLCMHYHRTHLRDPRAMPPGRALEMCTIEGAKALGLEREIGSLEVGKKADIILVDLARPHLAPQHMPLFRVVCYANGNDVTTVIIDGRVVLDQGHVTSVNERAVLAEAQREAERMIDRCNLAPLLRTPVEFWGTPTEKRY